MNALRPSVPVDTEGTPYTLPLRGRCGPCGREASEDDWYPRWRERMPLGDVPEEPAVG